ncbi:Hpt domain-containing protein [Brumimicrobium glaciale]|uniref:Hpt domain-containing protein n=1 Tax=Brumimicrobium glaciale TaxID=200475 RepID=A0A4Q4KN89_9FLAO|nr:Hpt domain-containing protein [Brumimicrobium glaciale]RYM33389.1 Hpt domain-containing protein [Brumimicrobium glaciale]
MKENNLYSLDVLDMVQSQEDKKELLAAFISESESCIKMFYEELKNRNLKEISFFAHKLKSNFKLFQIRELYRTIEILEIKIESLTNVEIEELINKINDVMVRVKNDINEKILNKYNF